MSLINEKILSYPLEKGIHALGTLYTPSENTSSRSFILFPAWKGKDAFFEEVAKKYAQKFNAPLLLADLYGEGKQPSTDDEALQAMEPLFGNRNSLKTRTQAAHKALLENTTTDAKEVVAFGFCFGGLATIELFFSGTPLKASIAFHPLLKEPSDNPTVPQPAQGSSLLLLEGALDPLVSYQDREVFYEKLKKSGNYWESHLFGSACHAFTHPLAHSPEKGLMYQKDISERAFHLMETFFTS